jgi:hypothetical protein
LTGSPFGDVSHHFFVVLIYLAAFLPAAILAFHRAMKKI